MRIAVYLVGQWRGTSYDCSKYLKQLFEGFQTDYYIYTWNSYDGKHITNNLNLDIMDVETYTHTDADIEKIRNSYPNIVSMNIGSTEFMNEVALTNSTGMSSFPQFYQTNEANKSRKVYENMNGFRYDAVIKLRPDIIFREDDVIHFQERIPYVIENPKSVFTFYHTILENLIPNVNLVWDYYTISSPFGMDCMMEWVEDVNNNNDSNRPFLSNYIIKYKLIPNPVFKTHLSNSGMHPSPTIMREVFKYNNLVDLFYKNKSNNHILTFLEFIYDYLFRNNPNREKYAGWFDWIKLDELDYLTITHRQYGHTRVLSEDGLSKLANLIIENYDSDEKRYKQEYGIE
jgi:hypothetical protein